MENGAAADKLADGVRSLQISDQTSQEISMCRPSSPSTEMEALIKENQELRYRIAVLEFIEQQMQEFTSRQSPHFSTPHGFDSQETQNPNATGKYLIIIIIVLLRCVDIQLSFSVYHS